jgi:hypothetical protein
VAAARVETAAKTHFEQRDIDARARKQVERRERVVLEERERDFAACGVDTLERGDQLLVAGLCVIDADTLVVSRQVRRGEPPTAPAGRAQDRVEECDGGPLAIGAADRDDPVARRQQTQAMRHLAHPRQSQIDGVGMGFLLPLEPRGQREHRAS